MSWPAAFAICITTGVVAITTASIVTDVAHTIRAAINALEHAHIRLIEKLGEDISDGN